MEAQDDLDQWEWIRIDAGPHEGHSLRVLRGLPAVRLLLPKEPPPSTRILKPGAPPRSPPQLYVEYRRVGVSDSLGPLRDHFLPSDWDAAKRADWLRHRRGRE